MTSAVSVDRDDDLRTIEEQARAWVLRLEEEPEAEDECDAWRSQAPAHDAAFREANRIWEIAPALGRIIGEDWRSEAEALGRSPLRRARDWAVRGTGRIVLPLAMAASLAVAIVSPQLLRPAPLEVATRIGQTQLVALKDGSRVTVGARSDVRVRLSDTVRQVTLASGQAFFEVAPDTARPFIVLAGDAEIRVTGTKFDVRRVGNDVQVSVLEGRVELRRRPVVPLFQKEEPDRVLTAGKRSVLDEGETFTPEAPAPIRPGEWRTGRLYYSEAPISEIVADLQRYSEAPIRIADADVGRLKVTTSFRASDVDGFVRNLEATMPIEGRRTEDGAIVISKR